MGINTAHGAVDRIRAARTCPSEMGDMMSVERFAYSTYLIRRNVFKLFGGAFHVYYPTGTLLEGRQQ